MQRIFVKSLFSGNTVPPFPIREVLPATIILLAYTLSTTVACGAHSRLLDE